MLFPPFEPDRNEPKRRRFRPVPVRMLVPNVITLLALCAGLTAIRLAIEGNLAFAMYAIVFAAALDAVDGRIARMIKGTSRFGAELDSLADFVNFGVVPGLILYFWVLQDLKTVGWIAAMVFAICAALRLARFNVMIDDPNRPAWAANFFTGMPAPAGAIVVLLPIYLWFLGVPKLPVITLLFTLAIALLMVSRVPVFSGKKWGARVPREMVLPIFVVVVLFVGLLIGYTWEVLTVGVLVYLGLLPFGWMSYRNHERGAVTASAAPVAEPEKPLITGSTTPAPQAEEERPARLN